MATKKKTDDTPDTPEAPAQPTAGQTPPAESTPSAEGVTAQATVIPRVRPDRPTAAEIADLEKRIAAWKAEDASEPLPPVDPASLKIFEVSLPNTCGEGTIRPKFRVELDLSAQPGQPEAITPLDKQVPHKGVRIRTRVPADPFVAGLEAQKRAIAAFNKYYGIGGTEHEYKVHLVAGDNAA